MGEEETNASSSLPDTELFGLLSNLLQQVESMTNQEEVELRAKIEALGSEVTKVPSKSTQNLDELEIAAELDKLSAKLAHVDEMISSADVEVNSLLSDTADVWMPVITANSMKGVILQRRLMTSLQRKLYRSVQHLFKHM